MPGRVEDVHDLSRFRCASCYKTSAEPGTWTGSQSTRRGRSWNRRSWESNEWERKSVGEQETFEQDTLEPLFILERA